MNAKDIFDLITQGGALAVLALILWSGARRWWIWGWIHRESEERHAKTEELLRIEVEEWKAIALQGTSLARESVRHVGALAPSNDTEEIVRRVMADYFEAQAPPIPTPKPAVRKRGTK